MEQDYDDEDDDENIYEGVYANGHWEWDNRDNQLVFISDATVTKVEDKPLAIDFGSIEFKEDIDLIEQQRFRKRIQRKTTDKDVVTLQDVKDLVLFTAPRLLLKPAVINILHLPGMERFLRALILYCQYYLQIANQMSIRLTDALTKVRTSNSDLVEAEYQKNLQDMRLLVVKEYSVLIMGDGEFAKYHHMGPFKKSHSLLRRDSLMFESILRISIQIVWIALGRKSFNLIELEVHRIFKSQAFNLVEHNLKHEIPLTPHVRSVLQGKCLQMRQKVNMQSPIMEEVFCKRDIDFRIFGLGVVQYPWLDSRLQYMERSLIEPEKKIQKLHLNLGILGMPITNFDIMLRQIKISAPAGSSSSTSVIQKSMSRNLKAKSCGSRKSVGTVAPLYRNISLPSTSTEPQVTLKKFPTECVRQKPCDLNQKRMWLRRLAHKTGKKRKTSKLSTSLRASSSIENSKSLITREKI